jgi:hypothetical protein
MPNASLIMNNLLIICKKHSQSDRVSFSTENYPRFFLLCDLDLVFLASTLGDSGSVTTSVSASAGAGTASSSGAASSAGAASVVASVSSAAGSSAAGAGLELEPHPARRAAVQAAASSRLSVLFFITFPPLRKNKMKLV